MIEKDSLLTLPFYNKTSFTGSYMGMRYKLSKEKIKIDENKDSTILKAYVFPGPFSFDASPKEHMITNQFDFSEQGISDACDWLNETYQTHITLWKTSIL